MKLKKHVKTQILIISLLFLGLFMGTIYPDYKNGSNLLNTNQINSYITPKSSAPAPTAIVSAPINNSYITGLNGPVAVNLDILDPGDSATLEENPKIKVEGIWYEMIQISSPPSEMKNFTYWLDLAENSSGFVAYEINITNSNAQTTMLTLNLNLDNDRPVLNEYNYGLANGSFITDDKKISINASDSESGINNVTLTIKEKFGDFQTYLPIIMTNESNFDFWEYDWMTKSNSWNQGVYELLFKIEDNAGAVFNDSILVTVDYTDPYLSLLSPANNTHLSGIKDLTFSIYDPTTDLVGVMINVSGTVESLDYSGNAHLYIYSLDTTQYSDGSLIVSINTTNKAGLINSSSLHFVVDNTKPTGKLSYNPILNGTQTLLLNSSDNMGFSRIAWRFDQKLYNELPLVGIQNITIITTKYTDGIYNLTILLEDSADLPNQQILLYSVIVDNTNPEVSVKNLRDGKIIPSNYKIQIEIYDATNCTLYCSVDNGIFYPVNVSEVTDTIIWELPISALKLPNGYHYIVFRGIDQAGNIDEDTYMFVQVSPSNPWLWVIIGGGSAGGVALTVGIIYWVKHKNKI